MSESTEIQEKQETKVISKDVEIELDHAYSIKVNDKKIIGRIHPIPLDLWAVIIGFHRMISIEMNGESVSYHRFHKKTGKYHSIIPFQTTARGGLSVHTNWQSKENVELLDKYGTEYGEDFFPACTIHTHVNIAAFESGTDAGDEKDLPGWHITLGKLLGYKEYDTDFRIRLPKIKSIRELTDTNASYSIPWKVFFPLDAKMEDVFEVPGTTDWKHLKARVR